MFKELYEKSLKLAAHKSSKFFLGLSLLRIEIDIKFFVKATRSKWS